MLAPEDSQRFEADYQHGSTAPKRERPKKKTENQKDHGAEVLKLTSSQKGLFLLVVVLIGFFIVASVFFRAWASNIKYNVNTMNQKVIDLSNEIDNLKVDLNSFSDLTEIESKASAEYDMVYPDHTKYIEVEPMKDSNAVNKYISSLTASQRGLASGSHASATAAARHLLSRA